MVLPLKVLFIWGEGERAKGTQKSPKGTSNISPSLQKEGENLWNYLERQLPKETQKRAIPREVPERTRVK